MGIRFLISDFQRFPREEDRRLKPGELELIIENSESPALGEIVLFALETAMRRSEIARMTWEWLI
jgi:integrase